MVKADRKRKFEGQAYTFKIESKDKQQIASNKKYLKKRGYKVRSTTTTRKRKSYNPKGYGKFYQLWVRK